MSEVRVRFAPSPTGGLHIGGVRTALFNYLFARQKGGKFILRIEDTDQARFVAGAEEYILETLHWLGIDADESPLSNGDFGPYRQSERLDVYKQYAQQLLDEGKAYYAFDTPEELDAMRARLKEAGVANLNYNASSRMTMRNSLTMSEQEVRDKIESGDPYVIRIKVPQQEEIRFQDAIRGWVMVHAVNVDDKVLMKSDGFPTYHLANVVDDRLMKITHVIRGEEWLPSAPLHVLLYQYLGWSDHMPQFAHLPLILKPDGNGKLSKRAADKAGFPIFPLTWKGVDGEENTGFREEGYLPEALTNFLALLGWNPGGEQELFSLEELCDLFSLEKVGKAGTKFDIEKAVWFNQYYLRKKDNAELIETLGKHIDHGSWSTEQLNKIVDLLKPRISFMAELLTEAEFFWKAPVHFEEKVVKKKWNEQAKSALRAYAEALRENHEIQAEAAKDLYSQTMNELGISPGSVMPVLRIALTGVSSGPDLMMIIEIMGGIFTAERIMSSIDSLEQLTNA